MLKILITDDEPEITNYIAHIVKENLPELEVIVSYSGRKSLEIVSEEKIDIALTDISMPIVSGFDIMNYIVNNNILCKVIFLTAYKNFDYIYNAHKFDSVRYLIKTEPESVIIDVIRSTIKDINFEAYNQQLLSDACIKIKVEQYAQAKLNDGELSHLILKIKDFIKDNPSTNLNLIAQQFHFNASYLSKIFKSELNVNISNYIEEIRIEKAIELLKNSDLKISQIAKKLGYDSSQVFGRFFKNIIRITPSEFRRLQ